MASSSPATVVGALIKVKEPEEGSNVWEVTQEEPAEEVSVKPLSRTSEVNWGYGPIKVTGYVYLDSQTIGVKVTILGIKIGDFSGSLIYGVPIKINIVAAHGNLRFHLEHRNDLYVEVDVGFPFGPSLKDDCKIMTLPF